MKTPQMMTAEQKARRTIEAARWPEGPVCPHCASKDVARLRPRTASSRPCRPGLLKCRACRKQFTVRVGTIMSGTHIPFRTWLLAVRIMSKRKETSAYRLHKLLGIDHKSAKSIRARVLFAVGRKSIKGDLEKVLGAIMGVPAPLEHGALMLEVRLNQPCELGT